MSITGRILGSLFLLAALVVPATEADVSVAFDAQTMNDLLSSVTLHEVAVPVTKKRSVKVYLENLRVIGFEPAAGEHDAYISTALTVRVPQFGLNLALEPRISLEVVEHDALSTLELRFERVELPLPLGSLNIARFLPPMRYPADNVFLLNGSHGNVPLRSRLDRVKLGRQVMRLEFAIEVLEP